MLDLVLFAQMPMDLRKRQRQAKQRRQLRRKRLGRRHANLDTRARNKRQLAFAHHRAGADVADRQRVLHAEPLRVLQCGQRISRLARLRNRHDQRAVIRHAVAVAVFAGDLDRHGDLGDGFDPVLGGQRGVVAGAAREDQNAIAGLEDFVCVIAKQLRRDRFDFIKGSIINLGSMWFVRLTLAAAMAPHFGLRGVWVAMAIELTVRGLLFLWRIALWEMAQDGLDHAGSPYTLFLFAYKKSSPHATDTYQNDLHETFTRMLGAGDTRPIPHSLHPARPRQLVWSIPLQTDRQV